MERRERILEAAARLFQAYGSRGATTRRIAAAAGVNEVTLFRHFGSKEKLLTEALARAAGKGVASPQLPAEPQDPERELADWCGEQLRRLYHARSLIRTSMGEFEEHPEVSSRAAEFPQRLDAELRSYLERLRGARLLDDSLDTEAAVAMLMGVLFADAMSRDIMPARFSYPLEEAAARYVAVFMRLLGQPGQRVQSGKPRRSAGR